QIENFPSACIRQLHIECYSNRCEPVYKFKYFEVIGCDYGLQSFLVRPVDHNLRKPEIILNDQNNVIRNIDIISVIARLIDHFVYEFEAAIFDAFVCNTQRTENGIETFFLLLVLLKLLNDLDALRRFTTDHRSKPFERKI